MLPRTYIRLFLTLAISFVSYLSADVDEEDMSAEKVDEPLKEANSPFTLTLDFDTVQTTKIDKGFYKGDKVRFAIGEAELTGVFYYCPAYSEAANLAIGYIYTTIDWCNNPWFDQDHFNTLSISLNGVTGRIHRWLWQGQITVNIDAKEWNVGNYGTYDFVLWGRYAYLDTVGIHVGLVAQTGLQMDRVYPILGADWRMSRRWHLNLVFPVNVSLEYLVNQHWSVALAGRSFNVRYRVGHHECHGKSLVRYQNTGAELAIKYQSKNITTNVHAGSTLGGKFRVADSHNHHPHTYRLEASPYVGAEVDLQF